MNVINLSERRQQQEMREQVARGRTPLFVNHLDGIISSRKENMGDRMSRIRASLERINKLMVELKRLSEMERRNENKSS